MQADAAKISDRSAAQTRPKTRISTLKHLDGRTVAARRATALAKGFEAELGNSITPYQRLAIERAAALVALAEDAKARRLSGDTSVTLEDVVRTDNASQRAVKALGIKPGAPPKPPSIREFIASLQPLPPAAPPTQGAPEAPTAENPNYRLAPGDGGPPGEPPA